MTTRAIHFSNLEVGKYYNLVSIDHNKKIKFIKTMGKLVNINLYGRSYDPDVEFTFCNEQGIMYRFEPSFNSSFVYTEYPGEETEDQVRDRIQERNRAIQYEIVSNDWALRPENVVATQGINVSQFDNNF
uniref:Uncharacterized protein n=1 Tax=viral metagenome TaxID=1070528 RepID=A0A6C0LDZ7_9ZZZZ